MQRGWVAVLVSCAAGCAYTPINAERQEAYFTCPNVQMGEAEASLAAAGWPIESASENSITTAFRLIPFEHNHELAILAVDRKTSMRQKVGGERYRVRITVGKTGTAGVRFHVFQRVSDREIEWNVLLSEQVDHEPTRAELNRYRQAVCGGAPFFGN